MKKFLLVFMFFVPIMLFASLGQNGISVAPDGTQLKWEEGAWDFFIMHKTLIERVTGEANHVGTSDDNTATNPQADTFIDPNIGSTYRLTSKHIPPDANVDRAFLVWTSTQDPNNLAGNTDNSVILTFTNATDPSITFSKEVTASFQGNLAMSTIGNFEYEALNIPATTNYGVTGVYTYRVEVSDFMKTIISMGEAKGMKSGEALYGDYNVKGMDGSNHENYLKPSGLIGAWFMPFVYTSSNIDAKKIYFYNGLEAYQHAKNVITVSGFELPDEAIIKLGLVVFEGDPGLVVSTYVNFPEGLQISGQGDPAAFAPLFNSCNPVQTSGLLTYTEMYNSISSIFGWADDVEECIGDPNNLQSTTNPIEYAIDADILMVDASPNGPFYGKFNKGDTMLNLQIGANQDQVFTNLLVVSIDTKLPDFDIPNEREKDYCSCSTEKDAICPDRPFYYTVKIQNHGENVARDIRLQDTLPPQVEYVPGTTEIATKFDAQGLGTDWTPVEDINNQFPFAPSDGKSVAEKLEHCSGGVCGENTTLWVRFVVKPKSNLSKNEVIRNSAVIISQGGAKYYSNSNIPLRLTLGQCPAITECELPSKMECGGIRVEGNDNYCSKDEDCKDGKKCKNNECVIDSSANLTKVSEVSYDIDTNSPDSGSASIIVPSPSPDLVLGQFYLFSAGDKGKYYEFHKVSFKLEKESDVIANNFKLYKDTNGNGKVDEGETQIAFAEELKNSSYIDFPITDSASRLVETGDTAHFLVTADVQLKDKGRDGKFHMVLENDGAFSIKDAEGDVKVKGAKTPKVEFASFRFEPSDGFVFTKGEKDPEVPSYKKFNGEHEMLQVRTKAIGSDDAINSIKVKIASKYAKFGEGIKSISLIVDNDKNGIYSGGDSLIKKITEFDSPTNVKFDGLQDLLKYAAGEEKYLIFKVEFNMSDGEKARIQIPASGVAISSKKEIVELPVTSKEFTYECNKNDSASCGSGDSEGGCAISTLPEDSNNTLYIVFAAIAALLALAGVKLYGLKK